MREKVLALARGNFIYEAPDLVIRPEKLSFTVVSGESRTEKVHIGNVRGQKMKGFGAAEAPEIEFLPVFHGEENELELTVNAKELVPGEKLEGEIHFVTDCGEGTLPYEICIVAPELKDSEGRAVRDYFTLRERFIENPEEGVALFHSPDFEKAFLFRDESGKILYRHLAERNTKLQSMEEFLVAMGKKEAVRFAVSHPSLEKKRGLSYEMVGEDIRDVLKIRVSTWGSVEIRISSSADWIQPDRRSLWTDESDDGRMSVPFTISEDKVREGRRTGWILLESVYEKRRIPVTVRRSLEGGRERAGKRAARKAFADMFRAILAFREDRLERYDYSRILKKCRAVLEGADLKADVLTEGYIPVACRDEAGILGFFRQTEALPVPAASGTTPEVERYMAIQYVKYLYTKREEDRERICLLLEQYRNQGHDSLCLSWIGIQLDRRYEELQWRADSLRERILGGAGSPLFYSELFSCYRQDVSLIHALDSATLAAVNYGLKAGLLTEEMAVNISFLAERVTEFSPLVFSVLTRIYQQFQSEDALRSICGLLIRSEKRQNKYFPWFERGVKAKLRLTELYEYYMYTMDTERMFSLPDSVISYFQYENHLTERCKTFLYAYIIKKREEKPEYFRLYGTAIREYALRQLSRHRISEDMGAIYEGLFLIENVQDSVAQNLPYVMFAERLICDNENMKYVIVSHREMKEELAYPLEGGQAVIQVYTPNVQLIFVDGEGRYHAGTVDYRRQKLLHLDEFAMACYENGSEHFGLLAHLASQALRAVKLTPKQAVILHKVANRELFRDYTDGQLLLRLYDFYRGAGETALLLEVLDAIRPDHIKRERLGEVASDCIYQGLYDKAEKMLLRYGIEGCDKKALAMLLQYRITKNGGDFVPILMKWAAYLYRERFYEQGTLHYLLQYYMGPTDTLAAIYKKCLDMPEIQIEDGSKERLLGQVLFTGSRLEPFEKLFLEYYERGSNRVLVKAFLSEYAYEYLVGRIELSEPVFLKIEKEAFYEKEDVMVLASLRYYSRLNCLSDRQREFAEQYLEQFAGEGRIFSFMRAFTGKMAVPFEIENSVLVQYNSGTDKGVFLHIIGSDGEEEVLPMTKIFDGIFARSLLLFEDEEKRCYIYEEETEAQTDEMVLKAPWHGENSPGFFSMVNDMIGRKKQGDEKRYEHLRRQYEKQRAAAASLFQLQ